MIAARTWTCAAIVLVLAACIDNGAGPERSTGPAAIRPPLPDVHGALDVLRRHTPKLLDTPGVVGTALTRLSDGGPAVLLLVERSGLPDLPDALDGVPVSVRVTGRLMAFSDPTERQRPAPLGYSVGHPAITAGTIGARVRDALGHVYILSNNHVLANSNTAQIGDPEYQPGPYDGGTAADQIATLTDFQTISFATNGANTIDAAIALSSPDLLDNAVPADDGYGMPSSTIYGDTDHDGVFDNRDALLGLAVQKYGRTTHLTHGQITGVNATVTICYEVSGFSCIKTARYVDQLIIAPGTFSAGGDSGSLIVSDDGNLNPVALLFAGSSSVTIANRIDLVLNRFGVTIDGSAPPPPGPLTDVAVASVSGPGTIVQHATGTVAVLVKNFGNQDVSGVSITLQDTTDHATVGTQTIGALAAGAGATLSFAWTPASAGDHTLIARQTLADDRPGNDQRSVTIPVTPPLTDAAIGAIVITGSLIQGHVATVSVTAANGGNQPVTAFQVSLRDSTDGVDLGTQTVSGLAVSGSQTVAFPWDLAAASLGTHTLIATLALADDNASNNRRSVTATVSPKPTDLAMTGITAPARVGVGDTVHVLATVSNVGEVDVGANVSVVLTDGTANNAVLGTQTVAGLAVGARATVDFPWNTAGAATAGHILYATQQLADANGSNNSIGVPVIVNPPADVAVTGVSAPALVVQGTSVSILVGVQNVGGQSANGSFDVALSDATTGVTIGRQTMASGLYAGGSATLTFAWNTATVAPGGHTLVAAATFADGNAANNQASTAVTVNAPANDVALSAISAPASIGKGSTATISVTVQNVGGQPVSGSFTIVLSDATAGGATLGTQTVTGLAAGASATRSFSWNTGGATVGAHTLAASHTLSDDVASNNQRTATVNVLATPADVALAGIAAPAQVTVGDTAPVAVTVQNVGGQDVTTAFDVVLTDGTAGNAVVGRQTIGGLGAGASATTTINWNTAGASISGHILTATQTLPDASASNNARAIAITVNPPSLHVGNLDGSPTSGADAWSATVVITAHDIKHNPVNGVTVHGLWNGTGSDITCVTGDGGAPAGTCSVVLAGIPLATRMVSFGMSSLALPGWVYKAYLNHDPDGSSNGFSIMVKQY